MQNKEVMCAEAAASARNRAHAPYSNFSVGAALLTRDDRVFAGCNVENISFGLTMCAERVALGAAIAAGERDFCLLTLVADSDEPIVPCGACRQVLAEFSPALRVISSNLKGQTAELRLDELLPRARQGILG